MGQTATTNPTKTVNGQAYVLYAGRWHRKVEPQTGPREPELASILTTDALRTDFDPDFNPCNYHAGHRCRRCQVHITDMEYIAAGLFFSLCPACLASARQTLKDGAK